MNCIYKYIVFLFVVFVSAFSSVSLAQTAIKGVVVDKITREPLELAVITNPITGRSALTDKEGRFALKRSSSGPLNITVSYIGYKTQQVKIDQSNNKRIFIELVKGPVDLKEVTIGSHSNFNTAHLLSRLDLNLQPVRSAQDLMRLVPGLFIAQHQGGGKAEQIFLRGFDADHGTDVNVSVDGMPVNMVSHAHGQGYADLHFLIPETVAGYDFGKGPYYTDKGDFTTAGYVSYSTKNVLDRNMAKIEGGQYNTARIVTMINLLSDTAREKGQSAYIAGEGLYSDGGPFDLGEHFKRLNLFGKFNTPIGPHNKLTIILSTLYSKWRASGEIPNRAVAEGYIKNRFGAIDSSQGGYTTRTNAIIRLSSNMGNNFTWENEAFYTNYYFDLVTNFTFYYADPLHGDEFNQHESRNLGGYTSKLSHRTTLGSATLSSAASVGVRYDQTDPTWLAHTEKAQFLNYLQLGNVREMNANAFLDESLETGKWLINAGARVDYFHFYYGNTAPASDTAAVIYDGLPTSRNKAIISPKLNIQYTLNEHMQLYLRAGKGFHSNDVRVVIANQGFDILPPAYGADLGINWKPAPNLLINTALWYLYLKQEFTYGQDFGDESVQPGGRTVRKGIDFSARYQVNDWLFANANVNVDKPKCIDSAAGHDYLALAPTFTSTAGLDFRFHNGFNGGIQLHIYPDSFGIFHYRPHSQLYPKKV
jgi:CarboxypepD_reg-like domain/TonB-dependent Receptor Plug Domain